MKSPTMLFKAGVSELVWGIPCETIVVDASDIEEKLSEGWVLHALDIPVVKSVFPDGSVNDEKPNDGTIEEVKKRGRPAKGV